jgi:hypothetical protein
LDVRPKAAVAYSKRDACGDDRELGAKFEVLHAVGEGTAVPSLERGLVGACMKQAARATSSSRNGWSRLRMT